MADQITLDRDSIFICANCGGMEQVEGNPNKWMCFDILQHDPKSGEDISLRFEFHQKHVPLAMRKIILPKFADHRGYTDDQAAPSEPGPPVMAAAPVPPEAQSVGGVPVPAPDPNQPGVGGQEVVIVDPAQMSTEALQVGATAEVVPVEGNGTFRVPTGQPLPDGLEDFDGPRTLEEANLRATPPPEPAPIPVASVPQPGTGVADGLA